MSLRMPSSLASSKVNVLPVTISSMALLLPTMRLRRCVPPVPGRTPRLISGRPILPESRRAMRRSEAMAVDRGDHQFGSMLQAQQRLVGVEAEVVFERGVHRSQHLDIGAGGEEF